MFNKVKKVTVGLQQLTATLDEIKLYTYKAYANITPTRMLERKSNIQLINNIITPLSIFKKLIGNIRFLSNSISSTSAFVYYRIKRLSLLSNNIRLNSGLKKKLTLFYFSSSITVIQKTLSSIATRGLLLINNIIIPNALIKKSVTKTFISSISSASNNLLKKISTFTQSSARSYNLVIWTYISRVNAMVDYTTIGLILSRNVNYIYLGADKPFDKIVISPPIDPPFFTDITEFYEIMEVEYYNMTTNNWEFIHYVDFPITEINNEGKTSFFTVTEVNQAPLSYLIDNIPRYWIRLKIDYTAFAFITNPIARGYAIKKVPLMDYLKRTLILGSPFVGRIKPKAFSVKGRIPHIGTLYLRLAVAEALLKPIVRKFNTMIAKVRSK